MVQQRLQLIVALEKLEDTKVVTRSRKSKKDRQLIMFESLIGIGKINNNLIKQLYRIDSLYACTQNKQYHNIFSRNIQ
jgi:hypothetical protein